MKKDCSIQKEVVKWSGRLDSNQRPPAPKAGTLAKLSHAPTFTIE